MNPARCDSIADHPAAVAGFVKMPENKDITHLVIDGAENRDYGLLAHVFHNEGDYPYLERVYDSGDEGFTYRVKVFEIDYQELAMLFPD